MKTIYFAAALLASLNASSQQWLWAKTVSVTTTYIQDVNLCDSGTDFYLSGFHREPNYGYPNGSTIIKFNAAGTEIWRKTWNTKIRVYSIATDINQNLLVAGDFRDTIVVNTATYVSQSQNDGFLLSLSSTGATNWFKKFSGPGDEDAKAIHVDGSGQIFVTGKFTNNTLIDGQQANTNGVYSSYIARYNPSGTLLSLITADADSGTYNGGYKLRTNINGDIYLLGDYNMVKFASTSITDSNPYSAQYLAKLSPAGQLVFLKGIMTGTESFYDFKMDGNDLYFTGCGGWTSGGWTKTEKYNSSGTKLWSKSHSGFYYGYTSSALELNGTGIYAVGAEENPNIPSWQTTYALMLSNFDSTGQENCTYINCIGSANIYAIARSGNSYLLAGRTADTLNLGNTVLTKSNGELFIARFKEGLATAVRDKQPAEDSFVLIPNPTSGKFELLMDEAFQNGKLFIYDATGNCIMQQSLTKNSPRNFDITNSGAGVYFVAVETNYKRTVKKLVLR